MNSHPMTFGYDAKKQSNPSCDRQVFEQGQTVFMIDNWDADAIEAWCQSIAAQSGQKVDWHYSGGRANILALGDLDQVRQAIKLALPDLNDKIKAYRLGRHGNLAGPFVDYDDSSVDRWIDCVVFRNTPQVRSQFGW